MKRTLTLFILAVSMLATFASCGSNATAKSPNSEIKSLVKSYNRQSGFDAINLGSFAMSMLKSGADLVEEDGDNESKLIKESIDKLDGITMADFSDCKSIVKNEFRQKLSDLLKKKELLVETKDDGESILIYSDPSNGGSWVDNLIIYMPDDCGLVCLWGSVNIDNVMDYAKNEK